MDEQEKSQVESPGGDRLLHTLVTLADDQGLSVSVTLYVQGLIISGQLIGTKEYLEGLAEQLEQHGRAVRPQAKDVLDGFVRAFRELAETEGTDREARLLNGEDTVPSDRSRYIHLMNARAITSDGGRFHTAWWRGRIERVDGFAFGEEERT